MNSRMLIGNYLRFKRMLNGYSMQDVYTATGVSATTIYKIENNLINSKIDTIITLLEYYECFEVFDVFRKLE